MSRITIGIEIIFHREKFQKKEEKNNWFLSLAISCAAYLPIYSYHFAETETWGCRERYSDRPSTTWKERAR